jgi:environmental stress-induced protein Ves
LVTDTIVRTNKFTLNLKPGDYEWRVSAQNGSSQTEFSRLRSFTVLLSSIKGQSVQLKSPPNNYITNLNTVQLEWSSLYGATKYLLQVDTNSFASDSITVFNKTVAGQQFNFTFPKDHAYQWRVRAENDTAKAEWSSVNVMLHDHTPPGPVNIVAPTNNQQVIPPVALQWSTVATATKYKLYVFKSDSISVYNDTFPLLTNTTTYNFTGGVIGERLVWKVSAIDAAGNEGQSSALRSFILR